MNKVIKKFVWTISSIVVLCVALILISDRVVVNNAKGKAFSNIDSIRPTEYGLLLGTTPQARFTKVTNYFFIYRIDASEQLYKSGKIKKILISGDENSLDGINEPECMKDSLVARGIPSRDVILDGKGYRTICSVVNANKVFGLKSFVVISQKFHNERAIYLAEHLGLDIEDIQGYNAEDPKSRRAYLTSIREFFARVKMFLDVITFDEHSTTSHNGNSAVVVPDTIHSFLGRQLILNDSICEQIVEIAAQDDMLSCKDSIVQIGDVRWRVNLYLPRILLFTSVQPDAPEMKSVVKYLNGIYGKPYEDEEDGYNIKWSSSPDTTDIFKPYSTLVHLRRVHSEEGGTFLFFN